jgi:hypothetical protein
MHVGGSLHAAGMAMVHFCRAGQLLELCHQWHPPAVFMSDNSIHLVMNWPAGGFLGHRQSFGAKNIDRCVLRDTS